MGFDWSAWADAKKSPGSFRQPQSGTAQRRSVFVLPVDEHMVHDGVPGVVNFDAAPQFQRRRACLNSRRQTSNVKSLKSQFLAGTRHGIKINLSYDFGTIGRKMRNDARGIVDFISRAMRLAELGRTWLTLRYPLTDPC